MKIAVFPGSFDPVTLGHIAILERALPLFDKIILAIGNNTSKNSLLTIDQKLEACTHAVRDYDKVECKVFKGLTVNFCKEERAKFILRGVRNTSDFEYEKNIALMNKELDASIETVLLFPLPSVAHISSSILREIHKTGGDISPYIPAGVKI